MTGRKLISSAEAKHAKCQHTTPCSDCPWRRDSLQGWLGGESAEQWRRTAHSDALVECHSLTGAHCAGIAIYRANVVKRVDFPGLRLLGNTALVFDHPDQFINHHDRRES